MARKWYDSHITRITPASSTTRRFWLAVPEEEGFPFRAGQFITMDLPIGEKRLDRWRSYSIASAPATAAEGIELCIVHLDGGRATQYLFEETEVGTPIRFKGPEGVFTLPEEVSHELVFVCTGTGVAPFRSMIFDLVNRNQLNQPVHLIFGTRYAEGLLYRDEFAALAQSHPLFSYSVALSREENIDPAAFSFPVHRGYVHQIYTQHYATPDSQRRFYLCGWSNMIDEARQHLTEDLGYGVEQVIYELYG
jgi:ferredoxin-NADP reductase